MKSSRTLSAAFCVLLVSIAAAAQAAAEPTDYIVVYGDARTHHDIHRKIVAHILTFKPQAVFSTGDQVNDGRVQSEWAVFNEIIAPLRESSEFYPVLGNHERNAELYFRNFRLPGNERWYAVLKGPLLFLMLDSNGPIGPGSNQHAWLEKELQNVPKDVRFVAVLFHHPILSSGPYPDEKNLRRRLLPLLEKYRVEVVFAGHDHVYERSFKDGVTHVTTGGGGAPLHLKLRHNPYGQVFASAYHFCVLRAAGRTLEVRVYDTDRLLIDEFRVKSRR